MIVAPNRSFVVPNNTMPHIPESELIQTQTAFPRNMPPPPHPPPLPVPQFGAQLHSNERPANQIRTSIQNPTTSSSNNKNDNSNNSTTSDGKRGPDSNNQDLEEEKGKRNNKKSGSNNKITDMPLRPLSSYNIFFSEQRKLILEEIEQKERLKKQQGTTDGAAAADTAIPPSLSAAELRKRQSRMSLAEAIPCVLQERRLIKARTKRIHRKVHGKISLVVLAREVSKRWKALSDQDREYYEELSRHDKLRHKRAMRAYKERKAVEGMLKITQDHEKPQANLKVFPSAL